VITDVGDGIVGRVELVVVVVVVVDILLYFVCCKSCERLASNSIMLRVLCTGIGVTSLEFSMMYYVNVQFQIVRAKKTRWTDSEIEKGRYSSRKM
jgi:hypothetical protein